MWPRTATVPDGAHFTRVPSGSRAAHKLTDMPDIPLITALGCAIRIDASEREDADAAHVARVWADAAASPFDELPVAHRTVKAGADATLESELSSLSQRVTLEALQARRGQLWMLHAAGVADEEGRVVVLIGPSGRGKTTASRAVSAVYGYVSDETVGIESDGRVLAYRKPLSIIEQSSVKAQRSPSELALRPLPQTPLRVAALVLLERRADGPDTPVIESCDLGDVLADLVAQTSYLSDLPRPLQTIAAHAAAVGGIRRIVYREAGTLADALAPLFVDPAPVEPTEAVTRTHRSSENSGVFRGAYLDAIQLDEPDRVALLQPDLPEGATLRLLTGIAPALWRSSDAASPQTLLRAATDAYGVPERTDAAAAVDAAIDELIREGVLATAPSWRVRDDVAWTGKGDRYTALQLSDLAAAAPVGLEGSAATVWGVLVAARGMTEEALVQVVAAQSGTEADDLRADVQTFLASLESAALAERIAP